MRGEKMVRDIPDGVQVETEQNGSKNYIEQLADAMYRTKLEANSKLKTEKSLPRLRDVLKNITNDIMSGIVLKKKELSFHITGRRVEFYFETQPHVHYCIASIEVSKGLGIGDTGKLVFQTKNEIVADDISEELAIKFDDLFPECEELSATDKEPIRLYVEVQNKKKLDYLNKKDVREKGEEFYNQLYGILFQEEAQKSFDDLSTDQKEEVLRVLEKMRLWMNRAMDVVDSHNRAYIEDVNGGRFQINFFSGTAGERILCSPQEDYNKERGKEIQRWSLRVPTSLNYGKILREVFKSLFPQAINLNTGRTDYNPQKDAELPFWQVYLDENV